MAHIKHTSCFWDVGIRVLCSGFSGFRVYVLGLRVWFRDLYDTLLLHIYYVLICTILCYYTSIKYWFVRCYAPPHLLCTDLYDAILTSIAYWFVRYHATIHLFYYVLICTILCYYTSIKYWFVRCHAATHQDTMLLYIYYVLICTIPCYYTSRYHATIHIKIPCYYTSIIMYYEKSQKSIFCCWKFVPIRRCFQLLLCAVVSPCSTRTPLELVLAPSRHL